MALLDLVLPQVIGAVLVRARAAGERAPVHDGGARRVLQLLVLGHRPLEPLRVALGPVAAHLAAVVGFDLGGGR